MNQSPHATTGSRVDRSADFQRAPGVGELDRRRFLQLSAASLALAGANGCTPRQPKEEIVPYVRAPEYSVPGKPLFYATALTLGGYAAGVLAECHEGRPTKIEGNPDHPASLGATDAFSQAAILSLYDPGRSQAITSRGRIRTWDAFLAELRLALKRREAKQGAGIRILTEAISSPTLAAQLVRLFDKYPRAQWTQYEAANQDNVYAGANIVFGRPLETRFFFVRADVVLSLDADFLTFGPAVVRYARDFISRRRIPASQRQEGQPPLNRLYTIETAYTGMGAVADHRLPLTPSQINAAALYLAETVGARAKSISNAALLLSANARRWLDAVADDLRAQKGLVVVGRSASPVIHALVHTINAALGTVGETLEYTNVVASRPTNQLDSLRALVDDAQNGQVDLLSVAGGNPAFDAPADVPFIEALDKVELSVRLGLYEDETSSRCNWHVPAAHELESWSDARAFDGTATILQPMIEPLYGGKTFHELAAALLGEPDETSYDIVRNYWKDERGDDGFEHFWRKSLHDGVVAGTRFEAVSVKPSTDALDRLIGQPSAFGLPSDAQGEERIEIAFRPDPTIHDGRFANNPWLQELPKPITKLTWDNAALLSPRTAQRLGVQNEQLLEIERHGRVVRLPAWIVAGHADGAITVYFGQGRTKAGAVGDGVGFNVFPIRRTDGLWSTARAAIRRTADRHTLACTQHHHTMEGRNLARSVTWRQFQNDPHAAANARHADESLYPDVLYPEAQRRDEHEYTWGMSLNLNACTGCNACVVACQAENNIPSVGKEQVAAGREMQWIRIDRYVTGDGDAARVLHQPVT